MFSAPDIFPKDWDFSVFVPSYLDINYFEKKTEKLIISTNKKTDKNTNTEMIGTGISAG